MNPTGESETSLLAFIEAAKAKGASDEFLLRLLGERGWPEKKIYEAFAVHYERATNLPVPGRRGGMGEAARDAFLYLLSFSMLSVWTISLGALMFAYLDRWLPDVVSGSRMDITYILANNLAMVIVGFPLYLLTMRFVTSELSSCPEKQDSGVRKWLTYIALFLAASVVAGDLITFINYFLRGELTARFVLKVATAGILAGGIFWYYLGFMKPPRDAATASRTNWLFALAAAVAVVAVVGIGFTLLGSPARQRNVAADNKRISELRAITRELYYRHKRPGGEELPRQLSELTSTPSGANLHLKDPETQAAYEYRSLGKTRYELCAAFATASEGDDEDQPAFWKHPRGRRCYQLDATAEP